MHTPITRLTVPKKSRIQHTATLFGIHFPLNLEPAVYAITRTIAPAYQGDYWEFYALSNGGFYMTPHTETEYAINCDNGFEGQLSADALGITACLYAYSHLSFCELKGFAETCAEQYHLLRAYMLAHSEANQILRAID